MAEQCWLHWRASVLWHWYSSPTVTLNVIHGKASPSVTEHLQMLPVHSFAHLIHSLLCISGITSLTSYARTRTLVRPAKKSTYARNSRIIIHFCSRALPAKHRARPFCCHRSSGHIHILRRPSQEKKKKEFLLVLTASNEYWTLPWIKWKGW